MIGELGLDGSVKPVQGVLVHTEAARAGGLRQCILPGENEREGRLIKGIQIIGIRSLKELVQTLASPPVSKTPKTPNTATAMGRSKAVPPFFTPAGGK